MTARKRRDPKLAGVAGVTLEDLAGLAAGRVTMLDIATRCGVTKQAVAKRVKALKAASPPASTSTGPAIPTDAIMIDATQLAISANLAVLHCSHALLAGGGPLGPTAIKALGSAIATARIELTALNVMTAPDDAETPTEFVIRVMTDQEHEETKRRIELPNNYDD